MKFWIAAALLATMCNLQHVNAAADATDGNAEVIAEKKKITPAGTTAASNVDENAVSGEQEQAVDDSKHDVETVAAETVATEVEAKSEEASGVQEELGEMPEDPDSAEYIAVYMAADLLYLS